MRTSLLSIVLALVACTPMDPIPHAPDVDANVDAFRVDGGPIIES